MFLEWTTISHFLIQIGCAYSVLLALQEFIRSEPGGRFTPIIFLALLTASLQLRVGFHAVGLLEQIPQMAAGLIPLTMFFGPVAFVMGRTMTDNELGGNHPVYYHFLLPTIVLCIDLSLYIFWGSQAITHVIANVRGDLISWPLLGIFFALAFNLAYFIYFLVFMIQFKNKYNIKTPKATKILKLGYALVILGACALLSAIPGIFFGQKTFIHVSGLLLTAVSLLVVVYRSLYPDMFDIIFRFIQQQKYLSTSLTGVHVDSVVRKIKKLLERDKLHTKSDLRVQDLANDLGISVHQTSRIINEEFEQTFSDLINYYRIQDAKKLLTATKKTVIEILFEVGFSSKSNFNAQFTKFVGMTPSKFRRMKLSA